MISVSVLKKKKKLNLFCRAPQSLGTTTLCSGTRKLPIGAGMLQLLTPVHLEPVLRSKRSPRSEACCPQEEQCPPAATRESPWVSTKTQGSQKLKTITIITNNYFSILFCSHILFLNLIVFLHLLEFPELLGGYT